MNKKNIFFTRMFFVFFVGIYSVYPAEIWETEQTDIKFLKATLLYQMKLHCQNQSDNQSIFPCKTMTAFIEQLDILIQRGQLSASEAMLPTLNALHDEMEKIINNVRKIEIEFKVSAINQEEDKELLIKLDALIKQLKDPQQIDLEDIQKKIKEITERYYAKTEAKS